MIRWILASLLFCCFLWSSQLSAQDEKSAQVNFHYYQKAKESEVNSVVELTCASLALYIDRNLSVSGNKANWSKAEKLVYNDLNALVSSSFKYYQYKSLAPFKSFSQDVMGQIEKVSSLDFGTSSDFDSKWTEEEVQKRKYIFFKKEVDFLMLLIQTELGVFSSQNLLTLESVEAVEVDTASFEFNPNEFLNSSEIELSDATIKLLGQKDESRLDNESTELDSEFEELRKVILDNNTKLVKLEEQMNAMRIDQLEWMDQQNKERDQMLQSQINDLKEMVIELVRASGDEALANVEIGGGDVSTKSTNVIENLPSFIDVYFDKASTKLNIETQLVLSEVVDMAVRMPQVKVLITGMADKSGDETRNLILSQERASQVKKFFVQSGLNADRFVIRYTGSSKSNESSTADRKVRIEFIIP
jgi:outer membrane protein OmpA-like peptidoglycan-associated protein